MPAIGWFTGSCWRFDFQGRWDCRKRRLQTTWIDGIVLFQGRQCSAVIDEANTSRARHIQFREETDTGASGKRRRHQQLPSPTNSSSKQQSTFFCTECAAGYEQSQVQATSTYLSALEIADKVG